jgi:hypothetical protein
VVNVMGQVPATFRGGCCKARVECRTVPANGRLEQAF